MKRFFLFVPVVLVTLSLAPTAYAAQSTFFGPIVPTECQSCPCGFASVLETIRHLMNLGIALAIVIAVLIIVYAGVLYIMSAANPESRSTANKMLMNAVIGLVIVLSAWLIVDFVMKKLYNPNAANLGPWNSIIVGGDVCIKPTVAHKVEGLPGLLNSVINGGGGSSGGVSGDDVAVRKQLTDAGITINHPACTSGSDGNGCTDLGGLQPATISQIKAIDDAVCGNTSGCTITVTGGSEAGHAGTGAGTHAGGYKVDIADTANVNTLFNSFKHTGTRGGDNGGEIYTDKCGNEYVHETSPPHWDITVTSPCTLK